MLNYVPSTSTYRGGAWRPRTVESPSTYRGGVQRRSTSTGAKLAGSRNWAAAVKNFTQSVNLKLRAGASGGPMQGVGWPTSNFFRDSDVDMKTP